jgi:DNA-directed RNA polymerase subunit RPC12/RpoP
MNKKCPKCGAKISLWSLYKVPVVCANCGVQLSIKGKGVELIALILATAIAWQIPTAGLNWFVVAGIYLIIGLVIGWLALKFVKLDEIEKGP